MKKTEKATYNNVKQLLNNLILYLIYFYIKVESVYWLDTMWVCQYHISNESDYSCLFLLSCSVILVQRTDQLSVK